MYGTCMNLERKEKSAMRVYKSMEELVGGTPLLEPSRFLEAAASEAKVWVKLEGRNPAGISKDRVAVSMVRQAEAEGRLAPGAVIIEPTSGNTGIGLAAVAASRGYRAIFTMPETMSVERRNLLAAYGAEIVLTPGGQGMSGAIARAEELAKEIPGAFLPGQFENPANPAAHYAATGPEIWADTDGQVDVFVAGIGTGGTISGAGRYLKEQKSSIQVIGVEPWDSPVLSGGKPGPHKLQGIGAGFVPDTLDREICDEILTAKWEDAYRMGRLFSRSQGILIGISGGAALWAALELAKRPQYRGKRLVVLLPDGGERYLSTEGYLV